MSIDLGTSSCKSVLFNISFEVVSSSKKEYPTYYPKKEWAEQDPEHWWEAVIVSIKDIIKKSNIKGSEIIGIGIDSQGSVVLPVNKQGKPLRNAMIWMDRRSYKECKWIKKNLKELLYKINGNRNDPSNVAPKILWIKDNEKEIYKKTFKFLHANGYIVYKITGKFSMDISEGGLTQLFDTRRGFWSEELLNACKIDKNKLPDIYLCHEIVGKVTDEVANITGLGIGTPVIAGSMDCVASALGCGVFKKSEGYIAAGTVTAVGICVDKPSFDPYFHIYHHIIPNSWLKVAGVDFGGGGLRWFNNLIGNESYNELDKLAGKAKPGSNGVIFLPYMVGQRSPLWDSNVRGIIFGLSTHIEKKDLIRMFMEGDAFGVHYILDIFKEIGISAKDLKITGGCSKSEVWSQIFADIINKKLILVKEIDVAALGIAFTIGVGTGVFKNYDDLLNNLSFKKIFYPRLKNKRLYEDMYFIYRNLYKDLNKEFYLMSKIREKYFDTINE